MTRSSAGVRRCASRSTWSHRPAILSPGATRTRSATRLAAPISRRAPDTIRLERLLDAAVDTVWRYLIEADLRREWFMGGTDATPGGKFELLVDHDNLSTDDVACPESYAAF